ncbi:MAG: histidine phosphatase family protein [Candidatus Aureabacteria bacterium]|nr:histidine phosphatase family protein [Candidatus Auribacterota bacterium]
MVTQFYFIRHGETTSNAEKRYCGFLDEGLSEKGMLQAEKLHARMIHQSFDGIYSSDRKRAIQTAGIVFKNSSISPIPDLREMHFGVFEGLNSHEIRKKYKSIYDSWVHDPYRVRIPEAETMNQFEKRIVKSIKIILSSHLDKTVAVVCHGGTISVLLNYFLKTKDFWKHLPGSASLNIVECENDYNELKVFNDTSHLK